MGGTLLRLILGEVRLAAAVCYAPSHQNLFSRPEVGSRSLAGIAEAKSMLGIALSLTVSPAATTPLTEEYRVLNAGPVPAGGFVQLASN